MAVVPVEEHIESVRRFRDETHLTELFYPLTELVPVAENDVFFNDLQPCEIRYTAFYLYKNASHENNRYFNFCSFYRS